ncbi:permease-like cell division protein FtsX [Caldisalinibacter kiritimatiensis]|uniref:Cell division protein FtsX n=1 Tax=Caldisalinibacter kiritimatiensis TaxID=1304284 RepID=R1CLI8_9FIRM|nr:permease-like cell division protein FtsX [Caldisalinibacter kiritimatiensis]EOC99550.1 Cell division protein FtsX [Caldisalinibacter kiritimatiensis]
MKGRTLKYMIKQGFIGMWRNRMMSIASVGSVSSVLIILGVILILILNINNFSNMTKEKFDEIQVYLKDDISSHEIDEIGEDIREIDGVIAVIFQSKEHALDIMKEQWGEEGNLLEGLEENPLPNSYVIQLKDISYADTVVNKLQGYSGIEEIKYYKDIVQKLMTVANYIQVGGLALIGGLMLISVFIISNTIKLTVTARKREINIMKYVGATNGFIRGPFIIEGMLLGLLGSGLSILIVNYGYKYLFQTLNEKLYVLFTIYLVPYTALFSDVAIISLTIGVGIGVLGSIISLRKFLRV